MNSEERNSLPGETGMQQSPIDLPSDATAAPHALALRYAPTPLVVGNNGYTIQIDYAPGSLLVTGDRQFCLTQFHFHRRSEHTIDGVPAEMELHLVHQDTAGNLAVVGVLFTAGRQHEALQRVWDNMPTNVDEKRLAPGEAIYAADLLPADLSYYHYVGSLTTPPCTEGVLWFVLSEMVEVSPGQVEQFAALFPQNFRWLQPLNGRAVTFSRAVE